MPSRPSVPRPGRRRLLHLAAGRAFVTALLLCVAATTAGAASERLDVVLDPSALPEGDRERFADRAQSIADSVASGLPLWRSFDARQVLHDSLAALASQGVDVGDTAIVNFDSLEATAPAGARDTLKSLRFVRDVRSPMVATPSGNFDSEGLEAIGSDIANLAGLTGAGVTVAIIDSEWRDLAATIAANELPAIPVTLQFDVNAAGTVVTGSSSADGAGEREHGTAAAEVVHEVAPAATLLAYHLDYSNAGLVTAAAIKLAIRHAADQGAKVILVPLHFLRTMSDPKGPSQGGTNLFADDITYAKAVGATVVVSAGNEQLRHYAAKFEPCTDCNAAVICNAATNDSDYHIFDDEVPLNDIYLDDDYDDLAYNDGDTYNPVRITCYSATDSVDPTKFKIQLIRFRDSYMNPNPPDYPYCPRDPGASVVAGTEKNLGESFSKVVTIYEDDADDYYFVAVKRVSGTERPNFRINCTTAVGELTYYNEPSSLSDLAVTDDSLAVGGTAYPVFEAISDVSSWGPTANPSGPMKPDLVGPSEVTNFAALDAGFTSSETFNGTSAAASHVAGVVALLQASQIKKGLPLYTVDQVKQILFASAIEIDDDVPDATGANPIDGHGLVQLPAALLPGVSTGKTRDDWDGDGKADQAHYDAATGTWKWQGSTAGVQTVSAFGGTKYRAVAGDFDGDGKTDAAIYDTSTGNWTFQSSTTPVAPVNGLGGGDYLPAPGDYDGDGKTDPGVYNPVTGDWHWIGSTNGAGQVLAFGGTGYYGVPADYDGDGTTDVATFNKTTGMWSYIGSTVGPKSFVFGGGTRFLPAPADFDGDGKADPALFQKKKGKWRFRLSSMGGVTSNITGIGGAGWVPVPADYDGDGKADPAAYRRANGLWRSLSSKTEQVVNVPQFGGPAFVPVVGQRP